MSGGQVGWDGKLIYQEVVGSTKMSVRCEALWQEHTATTIEIEIHQPGIQAVKCLDGAGNDGIN